MSLAGVVGLPEALLIRRIRSCSDDDVLAETHRTLRPFEDQFTKTILGTWPEDVAAPDEVVWFHGTRLPPTTDLSEGLLPFKACLPSLTHQVEELALEVGVPFHLLHKGEMSASHSMKLTLADESGPYGSLLRETVIAPTRAHRDFLDSPEIVYDLAHSVGGSSAAEILDLFRARTRRCVVWFTSRETRPDVVKKALMYAHDVVRGDSDPGFWNTCFNGGGFGVPRKDILKTEWIDG